MGGKEDVASLFGVVHVVGHDVEPRVFEVEVGVNVDDGMAAHLDAVVGSLYGKYSKLGTVGRGFVFGEVAHVCAELYAEHFGNTEEQVEIGVGIERWERVNVFVRRGLVGQLVLPVEDAKAEVLSQPEAEQLYVVVGLSCLGAHGVGLRFGVGHPGCRGGEVVLIS